MGEAYLQTLRERFAILTRNVQQQGDRLVSTEEQQREATAALQEAFSVSVRLPKDKGVAQTTDY